MIADSSMWFKSSTKPLQGKAVTKFQLPRVLQFALPRGSPTQEKPLEVIVTDLTYVSVANRWAYVCLIINLLATQTGEQYWNLVTAFPCKGFVLDLNHIELSAIIRQSISKHISDQPFILSIFTDKASYDDISNIANDAGCSCFCDTRNRKENLLFWQWLSQWHRHS